MTRQCFVGNHVGIASALLMVFWQDTTLWPGASKSGSAPPRGGAWDSDSLRAQSQRRDVMSTVEMINTACGETTQGFHLNTTICIATGVSLLLFFEHKGIAKPDSKKSSAHSELLPIRQSTGSSPPLNAWNCTQFQSYRPSVLWAL